MHNLPISSLPFFAYGIFRRGQISHFCIKNYVSELSDSVFVNGLLYVRDGIPLLETNDTDNVVCGDLIFFKPNTSDLAYKSIINLEPQKYYKWGVIKTSEGDANVLLGRSPKKGSVAESPNWNSWDDPLFSTIFEIIHEQLSSDEIDLNGKSFLKLQMTYLMLWSAIERFVSLRYNFRGSDIRNKILSLSNDPIFSKHLLNITAQHRVIYSTDNVEKKYRFIHSSPKDCLDYYYQIRCNITHRGKASISDIQLVKQCLYELTNIFMNVIQSSRNDS
jgi:hypothetical protein